MVSEHAGVDSAVVGGHQHLGGVEAHLLLAVVHCGKLCFELIDTVTELCSLLIFFCGNSFRNSLFSLLGSRLFCESIAIQRKLRAKMDCSIIWTTLEKKRAF